jgi:hypothetical protein
MIHCLCVLFWKMAFNVGLDASFDNVHKVESNAGAKKREINSTESCITNDGTSFVSQLILT